MFRVRTLLFVADDLHGHVTGFAHASIEPQQRMLFLDYITSGPRLTGRGVGGALYDRVREECDSDAERRQNAARLRFYEGLCRATRGAGGTTPAPRRR